VSVDAKYAEAMCDKETMHILVKRVQHTSDPLLMKFIRNCSECGAVKVLLVVCMCVMCVMCVCVCVLCVCVCCVCVCVCNDN